MSLSTGIAAVVVTYRSAETVELCLQRLRVAEGISTIRVVDNGSSDGTLEIVQRLASVEPRLRFIANPDNPGFAVACNQGAAGCDEPWLVFVNPDCLVDPASLMQLRNASELLDGALLGAGLIDEQGIPDPAARRRDPCFAAMLARPGAESNLAVSSNGEAVQIVDAVSGALMLLPRARFESVGGFDEGYRLHAEDLDLCRRLREAGGRVAIANNVQVMHLRGISSRSRPFFVEWHKHRGLWRYFQRFEAPYCSAPLRYTVAAAMASRFVVASLRAWIRSRGG
ncbi:MAG: glycosyltransferase family 2 protein [Lysobacter sp.]|nr:MAG: glycosyltransferase family 2 protein [Lysobacter sp.]